MQQSCRNFRSLQELRAWAKQAFENTGLAKLAALVYSDSPDMASGEEAGRMILEALPAHDVVCNDSGGKRCVSRHHVDV